MTNNINAEVMSMLVVGLLHFLALEIITKFCIHVDRDTRKGLFYFSEPRV